MLDQNFWKSHFAKQAFIYHIIIDTKNFLQQILVNNWSLTWFCPKVTLGLIVHREIIAYRKMIMHVQHAFNYHKIPVAKFLWFVFPIKQIRYILVFLRSSCKCTNNFSFTDKTNLCFTYCRYTVFENIVTRFQQVTLTTVYKCYNIAL